MLHLTQQHRELIAAQGEGGFPDEICGFLVGTLKGDDKTVAEVWPIENAWEKAGEALEGASSEFLGQAKGRRFLIPPDEWMRSDRRARELGLDILGCYHTHPNHPARPSIYDLEMARGTFPGYSYIILSVQSGSAAEMTSWVLRDDYSEFDREEVALTPAPSPHSRSFLAGERGVAIGNSPSPQQALARDCGEKGLGDEGKETNSHA